VIAFVVQTLRIAVPYLFAAAGGIVSERAGVIALTLEGFLLTGAFCATIGSYYSGSPWVGIFAALVGGLTAALLHAVATIRYRADQVVVGIATNLLAVGVTRFFLRLAFDSSSNSPRIPGFGGDESGSSVLSSLANPLVWLGIVAMVAMGWLLYRTPFGLRVRAAGEKPEAALSVGVPVKLVRWLAVAVSGMFAALGGAYLALDQHQFVDGMSGGRGFIALAAVIFGKRDPKRVTLACLLFAAAETMKIRLGALQLVPSQFVEMIPYILTIVALAGVVGHAMQPAALGKAVD
jgi:simple sugar transport system permease protein